MSKKLREVVDGLIEELAQAYGVNVDIIQGALIMAFESTTVVEAIKQTLDPAFLGGPGL